MMQSLDRTCDILDNVTYTLDAHIAIPQERAWTCLKKWAKNSNEVSFEGCYPPPYFFG
jgi:hypothetical protein